MGWKMEENQDLEDLVKNAIKFTRKSKIKKSIMEFLIIFSTIVLISILLNYGLKKTIYYKREKVTLLEPQMNLTEIIDDREKFFLTMYSIQIDLTDVKDSSKFNIIIGDSNTAKYVYKIGNIYYIAMGFGIEGKNLARKEMEFLIKNKIIEKGSIRKPIFEIEG